MKNLLTTIIIAGMITFFACGQSAKEKAGKVKQDSIAKIDSIKAKHLKNSGIEWISIPAGTFTMGSPESDANRVNNEIQHQVTLSAFKMSKYEITFEQYDVFCDSTIRTKPNDNGWGRGKNPVINITWDDAKSFADWMGCRLPTEAEWEYACRAGTNTPYSTGNNLFMNQANHNGDHWYEGENGPGYHKTKPVGSYSPNAYGLYDMHGNICEWCSDWFAVYDKTSQIDPKGTKSGTEHVVRGGCWDGLMIECRSSARCSHPLDWQQNNTGFRLVSTK